MSNFFAELKRRNVYKVAVAYAVVAWLLFQAASILLPTFEAPSWVMKAFTVFLALGFVFAVFISWAFEMTPQGMKRTADVSADEVRSFPYWSKRKFATFIIGVVVIGVEVMVVPEAGTTPLIGIGFGAGIGAIVVMGTIVVVFRLRIRPKSPVRVGALTV